MINVAPYISRIEQLIKENKPEYITYAALECRLAIEAICYDKARQSYNYISYEELRKWQPKSVLKQLCEDVDESVTQAIELSICLESPQDDNLTKEEFKDLKYTKVGTQHPLDINKLNRLWQSLSHISLHLSLPMRKEDDVTPHANTQAAVEKIRETVSILHEYEKQSMSLVFVFKSKKLTCDCGKENIFSYKLLEQNKPLYCRNSECDTSYIYDRDTETFTERTLTTKCQSCGHLNTVATKIVEDLNIDEGYKFSCGSDKCDHVTVIALRAVYGSLNT